MEIIKGVRNNIHYVELKTETNDGMQKNISMSHNAEVDINYCELLIIALYPY